MFHNPRTPGENLQTVRGSSFKNVKSCSGRTTRTLLTVQKPVESQKELAIRRMKEGTATATVQSGVPEWWDCATNVTATCRTCTTKWPTVRQQMRADLVQFDGSVILFGARYGQVTCLWQSAGTWNTCLHPKSTSEDSCIKKAYMKKLVHFHARTELSKSSVAHRKGSLVDQSSMSSAGGSQKKRKAVLPKESADSRVFPERHGGGHWSHFDGGRREAVHDQSL